MVAVVAVVVPLVGAAGGELGYGRTQLGEHDLGTRACRCCHAESPSGQSKLELVL